MNLQNDAERAIVRAAAWRLMRHAPWWLSAIILLGALVFGGHH